MTISAPNYNTPRDTITRLGSSADNNAIREAAARKNGLAWANIPARFKRMQRFTFSGWLYGQHKLVERFFNRIKHFCGIATRLSFGVD